MEDKKVIKIMHLRSSGGLYGAEMVILNTAREMNTMGCDTRIVCINNVRNPHAELVDEAGKYNVDASTVDALGPLDGETIKDLRAILKDGGFDILHCHDYKASLYGLFASFGLKTRRVVTNHLWDKIDMKLWLYQRLEGILYNFFDAIVAVSEEVKRDIRPLIVHKSKIEVIENGIDCAAFGTQENSEKGRAQRNAWGIKDEDIVIGIVGRLAKQKGHEYLLKAFARLLEKDKGLRIKDEELGKKDAQGQGSFIPHPSSLKLLIVGDGRLEDEMKALCSQLGLSFVAVHETFDPESIRDHSASVIFTGVQNDMPPVYQVIDILAMPSLEEGLPMALLEAMASGVPVVATPVGQIPEIIKDGETGFLVKPGGVDGLAGTLEKILGKMEDRRWMMDDGSGVMDDGKGKMEEGNVKSGEMNEIINNARELVREKYSANAMAKKYLEVYEWLVE